MSGEGLDCVTDTVPEPLNAVVDAFAHRTRGRAVAGSIGGVPAEQSGACLSPSDKFVAPSSAVTS